jgi:hypothetical protein
MKVNNIICRLYMYIVIMHLILFYPLFIAFNFTIIENGGNFTIIESGGNFTIIKNGGNFTIIENGGNFTIYR